MVIDVKNQLINLPQLGKWRLTSAEVIAPAGTDGRCYLPQKTPFLQPTGQIKAIKNT